MHKTFEIDFARIGLAVLRKLWIIILVAAVCGAGMYFYAKNTIEPRYTATATIYVRSSVQQASDTAKTSVSSYDIYTAQKLVNSYLQLMTANKVLQPVSEKLGGEYSASAIRGMIQTTAVEDTEMFTVSVTNTSPKEATRIANVIADVAPPIIMEYLEGSSVKVVDYAQVPQFKSYPKYKNYLMTGIAVGGGIALLIILLLAIFNSYITAEEDITKLFKAPVIGRIPNFETASSGSGYGKYSYYTRGEEK